VGKIPHVSAGANTRPDTPSPPIMTHHDVDVGRAVRPVAIDAKHVAVIDRAGPSAVKISMGEI